MQLGEIRRAAARFSTKRALRICPKPGRHSGIEMWPERRAEHGFAHRGRHEPTASILAVGRKRIGSCNPPPPRMQRCGEREATTAFKPNRGETAGAGDGLRRRPGGAHPKVGGFALPES